MFISKNRKSLRFIVSILCVISFLWLSQSHEASDSVYNIYPVPQKVEYLQDSLQLNEEVVVVYEKEIDQATKNHLESTLKENEIGFTISNNEQLTEGKVTISLGVDKEESFTKTTITDIDESIFEKNEGYMLQVSDKLISILGKDTDATFYGVTSLKAILKQTQTNEIRHLTMSDYSDAQWRGFIEGYYGIPWSNEDRISLMEFGGEIKMNAYMFAPKDDPYHNSKWRELYPEKELEKVKELTDAGTRTKNKFIWTIHPFMYSAIRFNTEENYQTDLKIIIDKFEQLYAIGVRQFGVLADDAGGDADNQVKLLTDLNEWKQEKKDVYNLIFVPKEYCKSFAGYNPDSPYLKKINEIPRDIEIMWTGDSVTGKCVDSTFEWFMSTSSTEGNPGREPVMWLNWPVNDINSRRLLMGRAEQLDPAATKFKGVITNPMQQAEASKTALFSVANYNWNRTKYDMNKTWQDSFNYIDEGASASLGILAKHMSDPAPNGHGLVQSESEEIKPLLESFNDKLTKGEAVETVGTQLVNEYQKIIDAANAYQNNGTNVNLKKEMLPWINSLRSLSEASLGLVNAAMALEKQENEEVWGYYSQGIAKLDESKTFKVKNLNNSVSVEAGYKRLIPFANNLADYLSPKVTEIVNPEDEKLVLSAYTNVTSIYEGKIENILDWKTDSKVWFGRYIQQGDYIEIKADTEFHIESISLDQGKSETDKDAFHYGKFQYSMDGQDWQDVTGEAYGPYQNHIEVGNLDITAKHLRFIVTGDIKGTGEANPKWAAFRKFSINEGVATALNKTIFRSDDIGPRGTADENALATEEGTTTIMYAKNPYEGVERDSIPANAYLGIDLGRVATIGNVEINQGTGALGDIFDKGSLEYSLDGNEYELIETFESKNIIQKDYSMSNIKARYLRFRNLEATGKWARFSKFNVSESKLNSKIYTNVDELVKQNITIETDEAKLPEGSTASLEKGDFVGIKLPRIRDIKLIEAVYSPKSNIVLEASINEVEWKTVEDLSQVPAARYIRLRNSGDKKVELIIDKFVVYSNEIKEISLKESTIEPVENAKALFDNDWTSQAWFKSSQNQGKFFVYDLGQEVEIDKLKMVHSDSEIDFVRNGKISLSLDNISWEDALVIGGEANKDTKIEEVFPTHEISYYTIQATNINKKARYLKFEVTKTLDISKWIRINEIEINDGAYLPITTDSTIVSTPLEEKGHSPLLALDGDLNSTYKPNNAISKSGSLLYSLTDNRLTRKVTILQSPATINTSTLSIRTLKGWQEIGPLSKSLNEFEFDGKEQILDLKIEWTNGGPTIHEIIIKDEAKPIEPTEPVEPEDIPVESVKLNVSSLVILKAGKTLELNHTIKPEDATNQVLTWSAEKEGIVEISEAGVVKGLKSGMTKVTATSHNGKTASFVLRVTK